MELWQIIRVVSAFCDVEFVTDFYVRREEDGWEMELWQIKRVVSAFCDVEFVTGFSVRR